MSTVVDSREAWRGSYMSRLHRTPPGTGIVVGSDNGRTRSASDLLQSDTDEPVNKRICPADDGPGNSATPICDIRLRRARRGC